MTVRGRGIVAVAAGALTAASLAAVGPAAAQEAAPDGTLVFASSGQPDINPAGDYDIFTMNADGTNLVNLTETEADDFSLGPYDTQPRWSPDGTRIVYSSDRDGQAADDAEIWVMDRDGSNKTQLTDDNQADWGPSFSPDGTKIAWTADDVVNFDFDIWLIDRKSVV